MRGTISIIGAGRVGRALGKCFRERGWKIGSVVTCSQGTAAKAVRFIGGGTPQVGLSGRILFSSILLICTPDDRIALVGDQLAETAGEQLRGLIVLHTSGAFDSNLLKRLRQYGAAVGSMHPLQTFNGVRVPPLAGKIFAIEGDPAALRAARQLVRSLNATSVKIDGAKKPLYHAAAALAAGHVLVLEESATRLLMNTGMNRRQAVRALLPLTRQVLDNFERLGPRAAWTGPLARGDYKVIASHAAALQALPCEYSEAYLHLNRLASRVLAQDTDLMQASLKKIFKRERKEVSEGNA